MREFYFSKIMFVVREMRVFDDDMLNQASHFGACSENIKQCPLGVLISNSGHFMKKWCGKGGSSFTSQKQMKFRLALEVIRTFADRQINYQKRKFCTNGTGMMTQL